MIYLIILMVSLWIIALISIIALCTGSKKRYMLVSEKSISYFETWNEVVAFVKTEESVDSAYDYKIFVKDGNYYTYITNFIK